MSAFGSTLTDRISSALSAPSAPAESTPAPASPATPVPAASASSAPVTPAPVAAPAVTEGVTAVTPPEVPAVSDDFQFSDEIDPAAPPTAPVVDAPEAETVTEGMPQDVAAEFMKNGRGRRLLQTFKDMRELEKLPSEGGLGFVPTAEQTKESFQLATHLRDMANDFHSGDPAGVDAFITGWFLPGEGKPLSPGAQSVAQSFLPTLLNRAKGGDENAASLYRAAAKPAVMNYVEDLYKLADTLGTPEERATWYNVARHIEFDLTGKAREITKDHLEGRSGVQPPEPDRQVIEIDSKLKRINDFEQGQVQQREQRFNQAVHTAVQTSLMSDIQEALKPLESHFQGKVLNAMQKAFHDEVVAQVRSKPENLDTFNRARAAARRNPTQETIKAAGKAWASVSRPVILKLRAEYLTTNLAGKVQESATRHQTLTEASSKTGTTSVAQPVANGQQPITPRAGEKYSDTLLRRVQASMTA